MNFLNEFFEWIRESYEEGMSMINESWSQIAHVTAITSVLIFLWATAPKNIAMFWFWMFAIYLCLLGACGYCKFNAADDGYVFLGIYIAVTVLLSIVGIIATGFFRTLLIVGFIGVVTRVLWIAGYALNSITLVKDGKIPFFERLYEKNPNLFILTYVAILIFMIWIPVMMLNVNVLVKIFIMVIYMFMMPIVSRLADEGIDIESIWD